MSVQISEIEINLPAVPPLRMYEATVFNFVTLAVIILPQVYRKIDLIHGDGGVGTIRISHLQGGGIIKERTDALDEEKLSRSFTILQGPFPTGVEKIQIDHKYEATPNGAGTIIKRKTYFYTTSNNSIDETVITAFNEQAVGLFKAFEAYLVANPDA